MFIHPISTSTIHVSWAKLDNKIFENSNKITAYTKEKKVYSKPGKEWEVSTREIYSLEWNDFQKCVADTFNKTISVFSCLKYSLLGWWLKKNICLRCDIQHWHWCHIKHWIVVSYFNTGQQIEILCKFYFDYIFLCIYI